MRSTFLLFYFISCICFSVSLTHAAQDNPTTLYLVRHAETTLSENGDLQLSEQGQQRAKDLAKTLDSKPIHAIYASHNACDKETAKNLAKNKRLFINTYDDQNIEAFQKRILQQRKGQNVLIVGNLQTISTLLAKLSNAFVSSTIDQNQFNTLYEIQIAADNQAIITQLQYSQLETAMDFTTDSPNLQNSITPNPNSKNDTEWTNEQDFNINKHLVSNRTNTPNPESSTTSTGTNKMSAEKSTEEDATSVIEENRLPSLIHHFNLTKKGLVLSGYDLVAYFKNDKATKGQEKFSTTYRDATFYFSTRKNLNTFLENPESFLPKYGGWCALGMSIEGEKDGYKADRYAVDPENFKIIGGELYLFYKTLDYDALVKWNEETDEAACIERADRFWVEIREVEK